MIFLTVGSQMPFDRLVIAVDEWAGENSANDVFGQIGNSQVVPKHIRTAPTLSPPEFRQRIQKADLIVAHAGMGSVLTALEFGKPIVVMPRQGLLHETRNDHQVATAHWLSQKPGIYVADNEQAIPEILNTALADQISPTSISPYASQSLIKALRDFIEL